MIAAEQARSLPRHARSPRPRVAPGRRSAVSQAQRGQRAARGPRGILWAMTAVVVRLQARGRVVLPAELRRQLDVHAGDELLAIPDAGGGIRLLPRRAAAESLIGSAGYWQPGEPMLSEQLIAERRAEAAREANEAARHADPRYW